MIFDREIPWKNEHPSDRAHNAIKRAVVAGTFPTISYKQGIRTTDRNRTAKPATCLAHSVSSSFEASENVLCGGPLQERTGWTWEVQIHFDTVVSLDLFEESLMRAPIQVARDAQFDQQMDITLIDAVYPEPPEQQSATGTRVTYRFLVELSQL